MKLVRILLLGMLCALAFSSYAQLTVGLVDQGPYTPKSTIAVPFSINAASCIAKENVFSLRLSDASGNFTPGVIIGNYNAFYSTFVNGIIPLGTPAGTGYKVRVEASAPSLISSISTAFEIKDGAEVQAKLSSVSISETTPEAFGFCSGKPNNNFGFTNESTPNSTVTAQFTNELTGGAPTTINFNTPVKTFTGDLAHYTIFTKAKMPDGSVSTKAYFLINNKTVTAFSTSSGDVKCLPTDPLIFNVITTTPEGIQNNFPGNTYVVNWGDKSATSIYTLCDILKSSGKIQHIYTESSCGTVFNSSAGTEYNVFAINISIESPFCGRVGSSISSTVKAVKKSINLIGSPANGCTNTPVTFVNNSVLGENPLADAQGCEPNKTLYNWYVNGVMMVTNKPRDFNFVHTFTAHGTYDVKLESINTSGPCTGTPITVTICIQDPPKPIFTLSKTTTCSPGIIKATNTSIIDNICSTGSTYVWAITGGSSFAFVNGTTANSAEPEIQFNAEGVYQITLSIATTACGTVSSASQQVIVNNIRTVDLSPSITLCALGNFDFSTANGPTKTTYSSTETVLDDVYAWTVSSANGGTYSFITPATSKYPTIKFNNFDVYTVTSTVTNVCGTRTDNQVITFKQSPIPDIAIGTNPICFNANANLTGSVSGTYISYQWVGNGTFSVGTDIQSDPANLITTYTPTPIERRTGAASITLKVNTGLSGSCEFVQKTVTLKMISVSTGINAAQTICTGANATHTPTTNVPSTFTWTAANADGNAKDFSPSGAGDINDAINNTNPTANAVVTYTITPKNDGCVGIPFTFTVTVTPRPVLTATVASPLICSGAPAGITLASNLADTKYSWTSTNSAGITGNTYNTAPRPENMINDQLINNSATRGTVNYIITPILANGCAGTPVTVTIMVEPAPTVPNAGADESVCGLDNYKLKGNLATVGTGKWTQTTTFPDVVFVNENNFDSEVKGLQPGNTYVFRWTISVSANCAKFDEVSIIINPVSVGGTATGSTTVCTGNNSGQITLTAQVGNVVEWQTSLDGTTWQSIANSGSNSFPYNNITQTTYYRASVKSGVCTPALSSVAKVTVNPNTVVANAGIDQILCAATTTTLAGNLPTPNTGVWTLISGQTGVSFTATQHNTSVTGLVNGQTYTFRWTISGLAPCDPTHDDVIITNLAELLGNSISTPATTTCVGQIITLTGNIPTGGNNTYTYIWQSSPTGTAPWTTITGQTDKDLNLTVSGSLTYQRIANSGVCSTISNAIAITALPPIANNTINGIQTICINNAPNLIAGSQPTGGNGTNYTYGWEQTIDETTWTFIAGANTQNYAPPVLTQTTSFRRLVSSGVCSGATQSISNPIKITVNPNAKAEFTFTTNVGCAPFNIDANNVKAIPYTDRNATYTWFVNGVLIGSNITFPGYNIATSNTAVIIKLVVTSSLGCTSSEISHTFSTRQDANASFTQTATNGCGPLTVNFTNTSINTTGVTYKWDFGNGTTSNAFKPDPITYLADPTGDDKVYTITLAVTTPCGSKTSTSTVTVKSPPSSLFSPNKTVGCSPFNVVFSNTSLGTNNTYFYDFGDGTTLTTTDKNSVNHTYTTNIVQDYVVKMAVKNSCGTNESQYTIRVSPNTITPELVVNANQLKGCAPLTVDFFNNTKGASNYKYTFNDGSVVNTSSFVPEKITHVFTKAGIYVVELFATNGCSNATTTETITVLAQPTVNFNANILTGCSELSVKFSNKTVDAISYLWDFGDGTTSTEAQPTHIYKGPAATYTVKLTAFNSLGCTSVNTKPNYIKIVDPPKASFSISPAAVTSIPNYTFKFTDESTNNPQTYKWSFGDGDISSLKDPSHKYADTGKYLVTMRTYNEYGCVDSLQKSVQIVGVPGYVYLPNSFMPGSTSSPLQKFAAVGSGIKSWRMSIFNKWGQVVWETTKLDDGKPIESWDGSYKGVAQPQGVYFWKVDIQLINGTEWKGMAYNNKPPRRTGEVYLIR